MSKQTLETLENEYLAKRKRCVEGQNQIHELQKKAKQRTEELTAYVYHVYRDSDTVDVKSYLNEMTNNLEQMNNDYRQQLTILDTALEEEKKAYLKAVEKIEQDRQYSGQDGNETV